MKKILITFVLSVISFAAFAQDADTYYFAADDGKIFWRCIYDTEMNQPEILSRMETSTEVADIVSRDGKITCRILPHHINYKGAGVPQAAAVGLLVLSEMSASATIDIKEGRYRVTVDNFVFETTQTTTAIHAGDRHPIEFYYLGRKGDIKGNFFTSKVALCIDYELNELFSLKDKSDDEW